MLTICIAGIIVVYTLPFFLPLIRPSGDAVTLTLIENGSERTVELEQYIAGVVAAEMPVRFEIEALKAQATASRSYALFCMESGKHGSGRLCTSPLCCQAYMDEKTLRASWGADFERNYTKILEAVSATKGEYLSCMGIPAQAVFHSSSAGMTEDSGNVWSAVDYLVSVSSPESSGNVPDYVSFVKLSPEEFKNTLLSAHPEAVFPEDASEWIGAVSPDSSGRVKNVTIGGAEISGRELRSLFSLRSTAFELSYENGEFLFTVTGFGHGVGMSQYGANLLAQNGADYASILAHYYPGTVLSVMGD